MHVAGFLFGFSEVMIALCCVIPVVRIQTLQNTITETVLLSDSH